MGAKKGKNAVTTPWRQDFRDLKSLPDIKIVRTHFLFNLVAAMFLLIVAGLAVYQQYLISVRADSLNDIENTIKIAAAADKRNQQDSARFAKDIKPVEEAAAFIAVPARPEVVAAELARAMIAQGCFTSIDFMRTAGDKNAVTYSMDLTGTMAPGEGRSAPDLIGVLMNKYSSDLPVWNGSIHSAELVSSAPDAEMNLFEYTLKLRWSAKPEEARAK
jgi:hypothetical protein